jgi:hypothetical protein
MKEEEMNQEKAEIGVQTDMMITIEIIEEMIEMAG